MNCDCQTIKQYERGVWQCMLCRKQFVAIDSIEEIEQKPVIPIIELIQGQGHEGKAKT